MKVVTQLIRYFWQRGALTPLEVESLLRHGFARATDLPGYKPPKAGQGPLADPELLPALEIEPAGPWETVEETLIRRGAPRSGPGLPKGKVLQIDELRRRLRREYQRRSTDLVSLQNLGARFAACSNWHEAAIALRQLSIVDMYVGFRADLQSGAVLLGDIWQAVDPEPLHTLLADDEVRGRAARAFAALLVADDSQELGSYAWLLKHDEMRAVINLRVIHERLLVCLRLLYEHEPRLLTSALQKNCDPIQFWSLVILYNARRQAPDDSPQFGQEYGPVALPEFAVWRQAWACALAMDRAGVTEYLIACYVGANDASDVNVASCGRNVLCPVGWHVPDA